MKKISNKNYIIVAVVSILVIVFSLYVRSIYIKYLDNVKNNSVFFDKTVKEIEENDLEYVLNETSESILYVSYTGDSKIYNMEKRLYRLFDRNDIIDKVIYWNVNNSKNYVDILKKTFENVSNEIDEAPLIILIINGEAKEIISNKENIIDKEEVEEVLTKYGII